MIKERIISTIIIVLMMVSMLFVQAPGSIAYAQSVVKVMTLGDSITDGLTVPGGYRIQLWNSIVSNDYTVDFVGSLSNGPAELGDKNNEGHSGWTIDQISAQITTWMTSYTPKVVMLQIGTNDVNTDLDLANAPARLSTLIDKICAKLPSGGKVYVATITPESDPTYNSRVMAYNSQIPEIVQSKVNEGKPVYLVDMYNAITTADLADGVHPNAFGYAKMGMLWFNTIKGNLTKSSSLTWTTVDQSSTTFSGTWETWTDSICFGGNSRGSRTAGSTASYTFTGTGVQWIGQKDSNFGQADVLIDGVIKGTFDCYSSVDIIQQRLYSITGLTSGSHTITIWVNGEHGSGNDNYVEVDAFKVIQ